MVEALMQESAPAMQIERVLDETDHAFDEA